MSQLLTASKLVLTFVVSSLLGYAAFSQSAVAQNESAQDFFHQTNLLINSYADLNPANLDFTDLNFSLNEDTNLYLVLYSQYVFKAQERAIKGTSALHDISESKVDRLILGNDRSAITSSDTDNVPAKIQDIQSAYNLEKNLFQTLAYLETQTLALEIFSNGDTSDSDFDLLEDLDEIETLLFAEATPSQFAKIQSQNGSSASNIINGGLSGSFGLGTNPESITAPASQTPEATIPEPQTQEPSNACPIDPTLTNQLQNFEQTQNQNQQNSLQQPSPNNPSSPSNGFASGSFGLAPDLTPLTSTSSRCQNAIASVGDVFCLRLETVETQAGLRFVGEKYCVNCVIENLATLSSNLVSASLTPRKVTGNFGEPAFCKQQVFRNFTMNINLIPRAARPDLELVDNIEEYQVTPSQSLSAKNDVTVADTLNLLDGQIYTTLTDIGNTQNMVAGILASEETIRQTQADIEIQSELQFIKEFETRLSIFNQNFINLRQQVQNIRTNFEQVINKPVCR